LTLGTPEKKISHPIHKQNPSIHPFVEYTYTNLVRGLGLEDTLGDDVTFVDADGDSRSSHFVD
jgi:hypothetical protein